LLNASKKNEQIGTLTDQQPKQEGGVFASFFGQQALTTPLVTELIGRTEANVVCGYAE